MHYLIDFIRFLQQKKLSFSTQTAYNHLKKKQQNKQGFFWFQVHKEKSWAKVMHLPATGKKEESDPREPSGEQQ